MTWTVGLVVPALTQGGGVTTVARFLIETLEASRDFHPRLFSVPMSARDETSVQLLSPASWRKGPQVHTGMWEGREYTHVGMSFSELEFQRYSPRALLTEELRGCDLVQIVAGTPVWGLLTRHLEIPVTLQVATLAVSERKEKLRHEHGPLNWWRRAMTVVTARLDRKGANAVRRVFVENRWMKDMLVEWLSEERVVFAPPGVDTTFFYPMDDVRELRNYPGYILSVGRFGDPRKDVETLMEAYARLRSRMREPPRLVLAGMTAPPDRVWERAAQLAIRPYVRFHHRASRDRLAELYRRASAFVLSSVEEGLGLVLLEAMASGIPVVSTATEGAKEAVKNGLTGVLVPVGDPNMLADEMQRLLENPIRARKMGDEGRRRVECMYSIDAAGERFLNVYRDLLE